MEPPSEEDDEEGGAETEAAAGAVDVEEEQQDNSNDAVAAEAVAESVEGSLDETTVTGDNPGAVVDQDAQVDAESGRSAAAASEQARPDVDET